jgi:hypothetical protein
MTYDTGTISTGQDADMYTALAAMLVAQGYVLTDTQVVSTRTHRIFKNPAANNSSGKDWYVDVAYSTVGTAGISIRPHEDYDAVNHFLIRSIPATYGWVPDATYYSRYGATGYALESGNWSSVSGYSIFTQAASFAYYLNVSPDCIAGFTSINTQLCYVGLIDLSQGCINAQGTAALPLVMVSSNSFFQTRHPKMTKTVQSVQFTGSVQSLQAAYGPRFPGEDFEGESPTIWPYNLYPQGYNAGYSTGTAGGNYRGKLKPVVGMITVDATVGRGDTVSDGTNTWVINGQASTGPAIAVRMT